MKLFRRVSAALCLLALLIPGVVLGQTQSPASLTATAIQGLITQDQAYVATQNSQALANFNLSCTNWTGTNIQNRAVKQPITTAPVQPPVLHVVATVSANGISVNALFTWGPDLLGSPCPPLPSAALPPGNVQVGQALGQNYYAVGLQDTIPIGQIVTTGGHEHLKVASIAGTTPNSDGSQPGYYILIQ